MSAAREMEYTSGNCCRPANRLAPPLRVYLSGLKAGHPALLFRGHHALMVGPRFCDQFPPGGDAQRRWVSFAHLAFRSPAMATDVRIKETLPELTDRIVETYWELGTITHVGHCPLPSYEAIVEIIESLKDIIFPGYRRRDGLHTGNIIYHVGDVIDRLHDQLTEQAARALRHEAGEDFTCGPQQRADFEALGQAKAVTFLQQIPAVRALLATDVQAAYDGDPACKSLDEVIFCYPGLEAITVYRLAHLLYKLEVPLIPRIMTEWAHSRTGIDIHPGATIGKYFFIDHGTGVVIGQTTEIGDWV
jgi:serine O-acetyltransferase